jgi:hypothetical protein
MTLALLLLLALALLLWLQLADDDDDDDNDDDDDDDDGAATTLDGCEDPLSLIVALTAVGKHPSHAAHPHPATSNPLLPALPLSS